MLVFVLLKFTGESVLPEPAAPSGNVGQQLMEQVTIPCVVFLHRGINLERVTSHGSSLMMSSFSLVTDTVFTFHSLL